MIKAEVKEEQIDVEAKGSPDILLAELLTLIGEVDAAVMEIERPLFRKALINILSDPDAEIWEH